MKITAIVPASAYADSIGYIHEAWGRGSFTQWRIGIESLTDQLFTGKWYAVQRHIDWEGDN